MAQIHRSTLLKQVSSCWNWKCALLSASARSFVYFATMAHAGHTDRSAVILVEMAYVTLTSGIYAALQQRALGLRSRILGDFIVVAGIPCLGQLLDWIAHRATATAVPGRVTGTVCLFALVSAVFHLHVMRNGIFLTGCGRSLVDDFRRMIRLITGTISRPFALMGIRVSRSAEFLDSDAVL
jgi:hypothetical protein